MFVVQCFAAACLSLNPDFSACLVMITIVLGKINCKTKHLSLFFKLAATLQKMVKSDKLPVGLTAALRHNEQVLHCR